MAKVIQIGFGPIAQEASRYLVEKTNHQLIAVVDINPSLANKDVAEILKIKMPNKVLIKNTLKEALAVGKPDVALVCTVSKIAQIKATLHEICKHKIHIVSSCEELLYPIRRDASFVSELNQIAKENGVTVVATGVNPGLLMDTLPLLMTSVQSDIESILIERIQDATSRRGPFKEKIGFGLTEAEFNKKLESGNFGHVGLEESMYFLLDYLNLSYDRFDGKIEPVRNDGKITGIYQDLIAVKSGKEIIKLVFRASVGEKNPKDHIFIKGKPGLDLTIKDAVQGDIATISILVHCIDSVLDSTPGFKTMAQIPIPHWRAK